MEGKGTPGNAGSVVVEHAVGDYGRSCGTVLPDVTCAIGQTPLVELSRLTRRWELEASGGTNESGKHGRILAKLEYLNPGFSKKDRIARQLIQDAIESGELREGQTVVELTSGNTGTGLAIVCGVLGHPFVAVMSAGNSEERARMMAALGAEVVLVPQAEGGVPGQVSGDDLALVEQETRRLVIERQGFRANQFERLSNARAHFLTTAPEIWHACSGSITAFCDFVGTGGSFAGCSSYFKQQSKLREQRPNKPAAESKEETEDEPVKCYIVEPVGAAVLSGEAVTAPNHRIQGGGYVMRDLPMLSDSNQDDKLFLESNLVDGYLQVNDEEAIQMTRDLARYEGIFAGFSSGANLAAAKKLLQTHHPGGTIVVLICDSGLKYLSTDLWEGIS